MSEILSGLEGIVCMMDDVLVYGKCQEEHDQRLTAVLERLQKAKVTLNKDKCKFSVSHVRFLGNIINNSGIHPDPEKLEAIQKMPTPKSVTLRCTQIFRYGQPAGEIPTQPGRDIQAIT